MASNREEAYENLREVLKKYGEEDPNIWRWSIVRGLLDAYRDAVERELWQIEHEVATHYELDHCPDYEARLNSMDREQEVERIRKAEYHRGFEDGRHSMDAEHRAIASKVMQVPYDDDAMEFLFHISAIICGGHYTSNKILRDELVRLMGGVSEPTIKMSELGNERHKAVCELQKMPDTYDMCGSVTDQWYHDLCKAICIGYRTSFAETRDRLIHLLGGDEPTLSKARQLTDECNFSGSKSYTDAETDKPNPAETSEDANGNVISDTHSIADELRTGGIYSFPSNRRTFSMEELTAIADRIDQAHQDAIQSVHDSMEDECNKLEAELEKTKELLEISYEKRRAYKVHIKQMQGGSKRLREELMKAQNDLEMWRGKAMQLMADGWRRMAGDERGGKCGMSCEYIGQSVEYVGGYGGDATIEGAARTCTQTSGKGAKGFVRKLIDRGHMSPVEFSFADFLIECDRAIQQELTRHRHFSFNIESTRWIDYRKKPLRFVTKPPKGWHVPDEAVELLERLCETCAMTYEALLAMGAPRDYARKAMPLALASKMRMAGNYRTWREMLPKRLGKTVHPEAREVARKVLANLQGKAGETFDGLS